MITQSPMTSESQPQIAPTGMNEASPPSHTVQSACGNTQSTSLAGHGGTQSPTMSENQPPSPLI
eukprot:5531542-Heterocapsa_arctica.AAC.1